MSSHTPFGTPRKVAFILVALMIGMALLTGTAGSNAGGTSAPDPVPSSLSEKTVSRSLRQTAAAMTQTQTINLNTGYDQWLATPALIDVGKLDNEWRVISDTIHGAPQPPPATGRPADVVSSSTWNSNPSLAVNFPNSRWISIGPNQGQPLPLGPNKFEYAYYFTLPAGSSSPLLTMKLNADDRITKVTLNNTTLFLGSGGVFSGSPLEISTSVLGSFKSGSSANQIIVEVEDTGAVITGLIVDGTVTYEDCARRAVKDIPDLQSITFWESTFADPGSFTFVASGSQLTTRLTGPLNSGNNDFESLPNAESYDVFYSDWDGTPNPDGEFVTVECDAKGGTGAPSGGALNLARVDLNFASGSTFANSVMSFVALGNNAMPNDVGKAVDLFTSTDSTMGNTIGVTQKLRVTVGFPCACAPPPSDMVGWWPLDETASATSLQDIIAGNNATPFTSPVGSAQGPQAVPGKVGGAVHFPKFGNGLSGSRISPSGELVNIGAADFSIDAWVQVPPAPAGRRHYIVNRFDTTQNRGYALYIVSPGIAGNERLEFMWGDGTNVTTVQTISPLTTGQWQHVAVTFARNVGSFALDIRLYVNGAQQGQQSGNPPGFGSLANFLTLEIGWQPSTIDEPITIDELEFFSRALAANEVRNIFDAGSAGKCSLLSCPAITINPATLVHQTWGANVPYPTLNLTATGGAGPHTFVVSGGALPPGMVLDPNGTLHGTPVTPGTYSFTVTVADVNGCRGSRQYQLVVVSCPSITINPVDLPAGTTATAYSQTITATGGCSPHSFSVISGSLPPGLTLASNGALSGTPTLGGTFTFTVKATDNCGCTGERTFVVKINCGDLGKPRTYRAGNMDEFASPNDPATASVALQAVFPTPTKNFDDATSDRFVEHTFSSLPANIVKAELEVRMRAVGGGSFNDSINLLFTQSNQLVTWGIQMASLPPAQNPSQSWNPGDPARTFIFDLANLPPSGSNPTNLIAMLAANRYLDIVIQDDTTVDYMKLRIWTCPPQRYFYGLPHSVLGQAQLGQDGLGNVRISGIGPSGQDGARIELGQAGGMGFTMDSIDIGTAPVGAFKQWTMRGIVDGVPDQEMWTERHEVATRLGSQVYQVSLDSSPLGATMNRVNVYFEGNIVFSGSFPNGDIYHFYSWSPNPEPLRLTAQWDATCVVIHRPDPWPVRMPNGVAITQYDAVQIYAQNPTKSHSFSTSVESRAAGVSETVLMDEVLMVFGRANRALGQATFEAFSGNLAIANIGSSGEDGVKIDLLKAYDFFVTPNNFNVALDPIDLTGVAPVGAFLQGEAVGSRNGVLDQSLGKLKITKSASGFLFSADFSALGSTSQRIQLFNNNARVLDLPGHTGAVGTASAWPRKLGQTGNGFTSDFDPGTTFVIDGTTYPGNHLRVIPEGVSGVIDFISAFTLKGSGIDEFTLTSAAVDTCPPVIDVNPATLPGGTAGTAYPSTQLAATAGTAPFTFNASGSLPPGLVLNPDGTLHGTPVSQGTFNFNVTVADVNGCLGVREYQIVISCPAITLSPAAVALPPAVINTPYSQSFTAAGGCASSFTFSVTSGALPPGLALEANGVLLGTATQTGNFTFNVTAADSCGCSHSQTYTLSVVCPTPPSGAALRISEFRFNGPNGSTDEFFEIFNDSPTDHHVGATTLSHDGGYGLFASAGNGVTSNTVTLVCRIPNGTIIPARGHVLCTGGGYSLATLGAVGSSTGSSMTPVIDGAVATAAGNFPIINGTAANPGIYTSADVPNDAGLLLANVGEQTIGASPDSGTCTFGFGATGVLQQDFIVFDRVGFAPYGSGAPLQPCHLINPAACGVSGNARPSLADNYCESTAAQCLRPVGDASTTNHGSGVFYGDSGQYSLLRRQTTNQSATIGTVPQDTANNSDDILMVSPLPGKNIAFNITGFPTGLTDGLVSVLGAAGPQNNAAPPDLAEMQLQSSLFDSTRSSGQLPNAERRYVIDTTTTTIENNPMGILILRFGFRNTSTATDISRLRFRVDNLSVPCGQASPPAGTGVVGSGNARNLSQTSPNCQRSDATTAVLKMLNLATELVSPENGPAAIVRGSVIEDADGTQLASNGGGVNNSLVRTGTTPGNMTGEFTTVVPAGSPSPKFYIGFRMGVVKGGRFRFLFEPEGSSGAPQ